MVSEETLWSSASTESVMGGEGVGGKSLRNLCTSTQPWLFKKLTFHEVSLHRVKIKIMNAVSRQHMITVLVFHSKVSRENTHKASPSHFPSLLHLFYPIPSGTDPFGYFQFLGSVQFSNNITTMPFKQSLYWKPISFKAAKHWFNTPPLSLHHMN